MLLRVVRQKSIIFRYWYLLNKGFRFPPVSNVCDDILMMSIGINSIPILNVHGVDYHCMFTEVRKAKPRLYDKC